MAELRIYTKSNMDFTNKKLASATKKVLDLADKAEKAIYAIAEIIAEVSKTQCYKDDGFATVHEWTEAAFGLKKTQSYDLLRIGETWISQLVDENGKKIGTISRLKTPDNDTDYTVSQLIQLQSIGLDTAVQLANDGIINPTMSCRELKSIAKKVKEGQKKAALPDKSAEESDDSERSESATSEPTEAAKSAVGVLNREHVERLLLEALNTMVSITGNENTPENNELLSVVREAYNSWVDARAELFG